MATQYIKSKKPRVTIFENVFTMTRAKFRPALNGIVTAQADIGYIVRWKVLDSRDYGLPRDRRQAFAVAIRTDAIKRPSGWPHVSKPRPGIKAILGP